MMGTSNLDIQVQKQQDTIYKNARSDFRTIYMFL